MYIYISPFHWLDKSNIKIAVSQCCNIWKKICHRVILSEIVCLMSPFPLCLSLFCLCQSLFLLSSLFHSVFSFSFLLAISHFHTLSKLILCLYTIIIMVLFTCPHDLIICAKFILNHVSFITY